MDKTKEKILVSVKRCQSLYGLKKMTMEDVANQANLSRQTVYEKFGSKKRLVNEFFAWLGQESLGVVAHELKMAAIEDEISLVAATRGIEMLYEGLAVEAPVQRESWARFLFEKDGHWWGPAKVALQNFLEDKVWHGNAEKAELGADVVLRHLSSLLWQPSPPSEAAQKLLPFLQKTGDVAEDASSNFEPEWD